MLKYRKHYKHKIENVIALFSCVNFIPRFLNNMRVFVGFCRINVFIVILFVLFYNY